MDSSVSHSSCAGRLVFRVWGGNGTFLSWSLVYVDQIMEGTALKPLKPWTFFYNSPSLGCFAIAMGN